MVFNLLIDVTIVGPSFLVGCLALFFGSWWVWVPDSAHAVSAHTTGVHPARRVLRRNRLGMEHGSLREFVAKPRQRIFVDTGRPRISRRYGFGTIHDRQLSHRRIMHKMLQHMIGTVQLFLRRHFLLLLTPLPITIIRLQERLVFGYLQLETIRIETAYPSILYRYRRCDEVFPWPSSPRSKGDNFFPFVLELIEEGFDPFVLANGHNVLIQIKGTDPIDVWSEP
mmetsp:Transcript_22296/g.37958  ORF Transcript_22296/g.37958 Transcript_22296/m.37958 type:complete len:225 (+) Transcript_22296:125-799(+)